MKIIDQHVSDNWAMYNGDSCEVLKTIPENSIHYSIFSPPFQSLFTYSSSDRDLGNCRSEEEFNTHFKFIINHLHRIIMPGRLVSFHCMNLPATISHDGFIGIKDFRGDLIRMFQGAGFIFHSEVVIWKDPLVQAVRTKTLTLAHKQISKDATRCSQGYPDYIVTMRKPGENPEPVAHGRGFEKYIGKRPAPTEQKTDNPRTNKYSHKVWQRYAEPVWYDIRQTRTLNERVAREDKDEKHLCLASGSLIFTKRGYIKIEDIIIGDETITHTGTWKKIIAKKKTGENKKVIQVKAQGVPNLITTHDHKIYTKKHRGYRPSETFQKTTPSWEPAKDIESHYVNQKTPPVVDSELTKNDCWIIGRWLADGHMDIRRHQFFFSIGKSKKEEFENRCSEYLGVINDNGSCIQYGLKKLPKRVRNVLLKCGLGAKNKNLPMDLTCLNAQLSESLLTGYISGDGHIDSRGVYHISSVSRPLLLCMSIVAQRAWNVIPSVYGSKKAGKHTIEGRVVDAKKLWVMTIRRFGHHSFGKVLNDGAWKRVSGLCAKTPSDVWNISVEDDASYTAEGCIVKNCPLQLDTIERCLELWTNPGDLVLSPFAGIGSEGYCAVESGRKFLGIELKTSYYKQAIKNIKSVEISEKQMDLFA